MAKHNKDTDSRWRAENKGKVRGYARKYAAKRRQEHPEQVRTIQKKSLAKNKHKYREKALERSAKWRAKNKERHLAGSMKSQYNRLYGITEHEINLMLSRQDGLCKICEEKLLRPNVDHCHETGRIRALLCRGCNTGIGFLKEDPAIIARALAYVLLHNDITELV